MKKIILMMMLFSSQDWNAQSKEDSCEVDLPSFWSPNIEGDGKWKVFSNCPVCAFNIKVYSRWGNVMYAQDSLGKDKTIHWDFKNKNVAGGTYFYVIHYKTLLGADTLERMGQGKIQIAK